MADESGGMLEGVVKFEEVLRVEYDDKGIIKNLNQVVQQLNSTLTKFHGALKSATEGITQGLEVDTAIDQAPKRQLQQGARHLERNAIPAIADAAKRAADIQANVASAPQQQSVARILTVLESVAASFKNYAPGNLTRGAPAVAAEFGSMYSAPFQTASQVYQFASNTQVIDPRSIAPKRQQAAPSSRQVIGGENKKDLLKELYLGNFTSYNTDAISEMIRKTAEMRTARAGGDATAADLLSQTMLEEYGFSTHTENKEGKLTRRAKPKLSDMSALSAWTPRDYFDEYFQKNQTLPPDLLSEGKSSMGDAFGAGHIAQSMGWLHDLDNPNLSDSNRAAMGKFNKTMIGTIARFGRLNTGKESNPKYFESLAKQVAKLLEAGGIEGASTDPAKIAVAYKEMSSSVGNTKLRDSYQVKLGAGLDPDAAAQAVAKEIAGIKTITHGEVVKPVGTRTEQIFNTDYIREYAHIVRAALEDVLPKNAEGGVDFAAAKNLGPKDKTDLIGKTIAALQNRMKDVKKPDTLDRHAGVYQFAMGQLGQSLGLLDKETKQADNWRADAAKGLGKVDFGWSNEQIERAVAQARSQAAERSTDLFKAAVNHNDGGAGDDPDIAEQTVRARMRGKRPAEPGISTEKAHLDRIKLQQSWRVGEERPFVFSGFMELNRTEELKKLSKKTAEATPASSELKGANKEQVQEEFRRYVEEQAKQAYDMAFAMMPDVAIAKSAANDARKAAEKEFAAKLAGYDYNGDNDPVTMLTGTQSVHQGQMSRSLDAYSRVRVGNVGTRRMEGMVSPSTRTDLVGEKIQERGLFRAGEEKFSQLITIVKTIEQYLRAEASGVGAVQLEDGNMVGIGQRTDMLREMALDIANNFNQEFSRVITDRDKILVPRLDAQGNRETDKEGNPLNHEFPVHELRRLMIGVTGEVPRSALATQTEKSILQRSVWGDKNRSIINPYASEFVTRQDAAVMLGGRNTRVPKGTQLTPEQMQDAFDSAKDWKSKSELRRLMQPVVSNSRKKLFIDHVENYDNPDYQLGYNDVIATEMERRRKSLKLQSQSALTLDKRTGMPTEPMKLMGSVSKNVFETWLAKELGLDKEVNVKTGQPIGDLQKEGVYKLLRRTIDKNHEGVNEYTEALKGRPEGLNPVAEFGLRTVLAHAKRKTTSSSDDQGVMNEFGSDSEDKGVDVNFAGAGIKVRQVSTISSVFNKIFDLMTKVAPTGFVSQQGFDAYKSGAMTTSVMKQIKERAEKGGGDIPMENEDLGAIAALARGLQPSMDLDPVMHLLRGSTDQLVDPETRAALKARRGGQSLLQRTTPEEMSLEDDSRKVNTWDWDLTRPAPTAGAQAPEQRIEQAGAAADQKVENVVKQVVDVNQLKIAEGNIEILNRLYDTLNKFTTINKVSLVNLEGIGKTLSEYQSLDKTLAGVNRSLSAMARTVGSFDPGKFKAVAKDLKDAARELQKVSDILGKVEIPKVSRRRSAVTEDPVVRALPTSQAALRGADISFLRDARLLKSGDITKLISVSQDIKNILVRVEQTLSREATPTAAPEVNVNTSNLMTEATGAAIRTELSTGIGSVTNSLNSMQMALGNALQTLNQSIVTGFSTLNSTLQSQAARAAAGGAAAPAPGTGGGGTRPPRPPRRAPAGGGGSHGGSGGGAGDDGEDEIKTPLNYTISDRILQSLTSPRHQRRVVPFEEERTVKQARRADSGDMELISRMMRTQIYNGRFLSEKVSGDTLVRGLFEALRSVTTDTGGKLVHTKQDGSRQWTMDFEGMGMKPAAVARAGMMRDPETGRMVRKDFQQPIQLSVEQQMKLINQLAADLERFTAAMRAARTFDPNAGKQFGIHNDREIFGKQEVLWNLRGSDNRAMKTMSVSVDESGKSTIKSLTTASDALAQFRNNADSAFKRVMLWGSMSFVIYGVVNQFQKMVQVTAEVDEKMHRLQFLMNRTATDFDTLGKAAFKVSRDYGVSIGETLDAMVTFAQQGRSQAEVLELVKASLSAANQTELTATAATEALTAAMATFGTEASDAMRIVDAWSNLANKSAVSSVVLAEALKKVGSTARVAGMDFHEFNALVATVNEATRKSGSEIGTSLKFIFQSVQSPETIKSLEALGIAVFQTQGQMRPFMDILKDLHDRFGTLSDAQQVNVLRAVASRRHYADLAVVLSNFGDIQQKISDSSDSFGTAQRNNAIVMEGFNKQIAQMKVDFSEAGTALAGSGIMTGILTVTRLMGGFAQITKSLPGSITGVATVIAALSYGLSLLSRATIGLGGQGIPSMTRSLHAGVAAQKLLQQETKATAVALLSEANAMEAVAQRAARLSGISDATKAHIATPEGGRILLRKYSAGVSQKWGSELTGAGASDLEKGVGTLAGGYVTDQKRLYAQAYGSIGAFAGAAFLSSFSAKLRQNNEYGDIGVDVAASLSEAIEKGLVGAGAGAMFGGGIGAAIGGAGGLLFGLLSTFEEFADANEKSRQSSLKFSESIKSQIGAVEQLKREMRDFAQADSERDALTGDVRKVDYPKDHSLGIYQRYAQSIGQLGKLSVSSGFDPLEMLNKATGKVKVDSDFGLQINEMTRGLSDMGKAGDGLGRVIDELAKVLDRVSQSSAIDFFEQTRQKMQELGAETEAYQEKLLNPITLSGGITGNTVWGNKAMAGITGFLGMRDTSASYRGRAAALEDRGVLDVMTGRGRGYDNAGVTQARAAARGLEQFLKAMDEVQGQIRSLKVEGAGDRMDLAKRGMESLIPGIVGLAAKQIDKAGVDSKSVRTFDDLAKAVEALKKNPEANQNAIGVLEGFMTDYSRTIQAAASKGLRGSTMSSIDAQYAYNRQEGYDSSFSPAFNGGKVDQKRLAEMIGPGAQAIANTGNTWESAVVAGMDKDTGKLDVVITRQKKFGQQIQQVAADTKKMTAQEYADLAKAMQQSAEQFQLANPGYNSKRFFSGMVEDIEKEVRDIIVATERVMAVYRKQTREYTDQLKIAQSVARDTAPSIKSAMGELEGYTSLSNMRQRQVFGEPGALSINQLYTQPFDVQGMQAEVNKLLNGEVSAKGTNLPSAPSTIKEAMDANRNVERENTKATQSLTKSVDTLTQTLTRDTLKQMGATSPTLLASWRNQLGDLDKAVGAGDKTQINKLLGEFLDSAANDSHMNLNRAQVYADFNKDPHKALAGLYGQVNTQVPIEGMLQKGMLPTSFDKIGTAITAGAFSGQTVGLEQLRQAFDLARVMMNKFARDVIVMDSKNPLGKLASGQVGATKDQMLSLARQFPGIVQGDTDQERESYLDSMISTRDPQKFLRAAGEFAQNSATLDAEVADRHQQELDQFATAAAKAVQIFGTAVDRVNKDRAIDDLAQMFGNLSRFGMGGAGMEMLGKLLVQPKDVYGRTMSPDQLPLGNLTRSIASNTGKPEDQVAKELRKQMAGQLALVTGQTYGQTEQSLQMLGKKFDVWKDMDITSESVSNLKRAIDTLLDTTNLDKNSDAVKKLMGIWEDFEDKRVAQQRFFDTADTRLMKDYAEQLISTGAGPESFSDQLRGVVRGDAYLQRKGIEAGVIPGINTEDLARAQAQLNDVLDKGISPAYDALRGSIFDEEDGKPKELAFNSSVQIDPKLEALMAWTERFTGGPIALNFMAGVLGGADGSAPRFHSGGLTADETPAVLKKGEAVIPAGLTHLLPKELLQQLGTTGSGLRTLAGGVMPSFHNGGVMGWFKNLFATPTIETIKHEPKTYRAYHGTQRVIDGQLDPNKSNPKNLYGPGAIYATSNPEVASEYAEQKSPYSTFSVRENSAPNVMPLDITMANPFDIEREYSWKEAIDIVGQKRAKRLGRMIENEHRFEKGQTRFGYGKPVSGRELYQHISVMGYQGLPGERVLPHQGNKEFANRLLKNANYDGITHVGGGIFNAADMSRRHQVYIPFDAKQVKSAITGKVYGDVQTQISAVKASGEMLNLADSGGGRRRAGEFYGFNETLDTIAKAIYAGEVKGGWSMPNQFMDGVYGSAYANSSLGKGKFGILLNEKFMGQTELMRSTMFEELLHNVATSDRKMMKPLLKTLRAGDVDMKDVSKTLSVLNAWREDTGIDLGYGKAYAKQLGFHQGGDYVHNMNFVGGRPMGKRQIGWKTNMHVMMQELLARASEPLALTQMLTSLQNGQADYDPGVKALFKALVKTIAPKHAAAVEGGTRRWTDPAAKGEWTDYVLKVLDAGVDLITGERALDFDDINVQNRLEEALGRKDATIRDAHDMEPIGEEEVAEKRRARIKALRERHDRRRAMAAEGRGFTIGTEPPPGSDPTQVRPLTDAELNELRTRIMTPAPESVPHTTPVAAPEPAPATPEAPKPRLGWKRGAFLAGSTIMGGLPGLAMAGGSLLALGNRKLPGFYDSSLWLARNLKALAQNKTVRRKAGQFWEGFRNEVFGPDGTPLGEEGALTFRESPLPAAEPLRPAGSAPEGDFIEFRTGVEEVAREAAPAAEPRPERFVIEGRERINTPFENLREQAEAAGWNLPPGPEAPAPAAANPITDPQARSLDNFLLGKEFEAEMARNAFGETPAGLPSMEATATAPARGSRYGKLGRFALHNSGSALRFGAQQLIPGIVDLVHGDLGNMTWGERSKYAGTMLATGAGFFAAEKIGRGVGAGLGNMFGGAGAKIGGNLVGGGFGLIGAGLAAKSLVHGYDRFNQDLENGNVGAGAVGAYVLNTGINTGFLLGGVGGTMAAGGAALTAAGLSGAGLTAGAAVVGAAALPIAVLAGGALAVKASVDAKEAATKAIERSDVEMAFFQKGLKKLEGAWGVGGEMRKIYGEAEADKVIRTYLDASKTDWNESEIQKYVSGLTNKDAIAKAVMEQQAKELAAKQASQAQQAQAQQTSPQELAKLTQLENDFSQRLRQQDTPELRAKREQQQFEQQRGMIIQYRQQYNDTREQLNYLDSLRKGYSADSIPGSLLRNIEDTSRMAEELKRLSLYGKDLSDPSLRSAIMNTRRQFHMGGASTEDQLATVKKGEVYIPNQLVPEVPQELLNKLPGGNVLTGERLKGGSTQTTVQQNQQNDIQVPVNVQVVVDGKGRGSSPEEIREVIAEALGKEDLLKKILQAPLSMLMR